MEWGSNVFQAHSSRVPQPSIACLGHPRAPTPHFTERSVNNLSTSHGAQTAPSLLWRPLPAPTTSLSPAALARPQQSWVWPLSPGSHCASACPCGYQGIPALCDGLGDHPA